MKDDSLIHIFQPGSMRRSEICLTSHPGTGRDHKDQKQDRPLVQHLFSRDKRRLQESGCGKRTDGDKTGTLAL